MTTPQPQHRTQAPRIHAFAPGRHVSTAGEAIEFSQADLAATAAAYNPKLYRAPLVKGHPKTDDPAQGWIGGMQATPRGLVAIAEQVDPAFAEEVRAGKWGAVSLKFYRPTDPNNPAPGVWYPRHLGFLGAQPPAVKGLDRPEFAEAGASDDGCVCFAEGVAFGGWEERTNASLWRSLREWLIAKFGTDEADKVVSNYQVNDLLAAAERELAEEQSAVSPAAFAEGQAGAAAQLESTVTEQEAQALREQNAALQRERDELRAADAKRKAAAVKAEAVAFAEGLVAQARIPDAFKDMVAAVDAAMQSGDPVEFGEGTEKKPLHLAMRGFLEQLPPMVGTTEQATRERAAGGADKLPDAQFAEGEADADRLALDARIREHAKTHGLSYAVAAQAVMRGTGR